MPHKIHDPESIFWVSYNTFLKTVTPKIAKFDDFWPFYKLKPIEKLKYGPKILHGRRVHLNKDSLKKNLVTKISRYLNYEKSVFLQFFKWKQMLLPHLKFIDLDKIFTEDTSHYEVPPCKISSKSEHFKYPKLSSKIKKWKKMTLKIVFWRETWPCYGRDVWTKGQNSF